MSACKRDLPHACLFPNGYSGQGCIQGPKSLGLHYFCRHISWGEDQKWNSCETQCPYRVAVLHSMVLPTMSYIWPWDSVFFLTEFIFSSQAFDVLSSNYNLEFVLRFAKPCVLQIFFEMFLATFILKYLPFLLLWIFLNLKMTLPNYKKDLQRPTRHIFSQFLG